MNNIYDLEGNMYEWTQEDYGVCCRINRGGGYYDYGNKMSDRWDTYPDNGDTIFSSRPSLYLK